MEKTVKNLAWLMAITCLMACGCSGHKGASVSNGSDTALQAGKALRSSATMVAVADEDSSAAMDFLRRFVLDLEFTDTIGSLLDSCLTPHARALFSRAGEEHDMDAIVKAQDTPDDFEQTLQFHRLKTGWYKMQYRAEWLATKTESNLFYVIRDRRDGRLRVAYVQGLDTTKLTKAKNNDSFFLAVEPEIKVDGGTPYKFLSAFYKAYTAVYFSLDAQIEKETAALRAEYLSDDARRQYAAAASEYDMDGMYGYDALIGAFYTTVSREKARMIKEVAKGVFSVGDGTELTVARVGGRWLITKIKVTPGS